MSRFEEIINKDYLYIDKTEYVYRMAHGASMYYFPGRLQRFGKSLLASTLHSFFERLDNRRIDAC